MLLLTTIIIIQVICSKLDTYDILRLETEREVNKREKEYIYSRQQANEIQQSSGPYLLNETFSGQEYGTSSHHASQRIVADTTDGQQCGWPLPLYTPNMFTGNAQTNTYSNSSTELVSAALARLVAFGKHHSNEVLLRLTRGKILCHYRNGEFCGDDGDVDIVFSLQGGANASATKGILIDLAQGQQSIQYANWAVKKLGRIRLYLLTPEQNEQNEIFFLAKQNLCLLYFEEWDTHFYVLPQPLVLDEIVGFYGPFWFVRLPWKDFFVNNWYKSSQTKKGYMNRNWRQSLTIMHAMDTNRDGAVSVSELDDHVKGTGVIWERYMSQISHHQRCCAAAMINWIAEYDQQPYAIDESEFFQKICTQECCNHVFFSRHDLSHALPTAEQTYWGLHQSDKCH